MRRLAPVVAFVVACGSAEPAVVGQSAVTVRIPVPSDVKARQEKDLPVPAADRRAPTADPEAPEQAREPPPPQYPNPWSGPIGGPACAALTDCCLRLVQRMARQGQTVAPSTCQQMLGYPSMMCAQVMPMMAQEATKQGIRCRTYP